MFSSFAIISSLIVTSSSTVTFRSNDSILPDTANSRKDTPILNARNDTQIIPFWVTDIKSSASLLVFENTRQTNTIQTKASSKSYRVVCFYWCEDASGAVVKKLSVRKFVRNKSCEVRKKVRKCDSPNFLTKFVKIQCVSGMGQSQWSLHFKSQPIRERF